MSKLFKLVLQKTREEGVFFVLRRVLHHGPEMFKRYLSFSYWSRRHAYRKMLEQGDNKSRFTSIYEQNLWSESESVSGTGSTLEYTESIRREIPLIIEKYHIKSLLDAPCGDFNWMREVLDSCDDITYIGGDIVEPIIEKNKATYSSNNVLFSVMDITSDNLPDCDLMLVRDCLFHLSFEDISNFLGNLSKSNIKYLLTTSHIFKESHLNKDIVSGDYRFIDIFAHPFNFPAPPLERVEDWAPPEPERELLLFEVKKLPESLEQA